MKNYFTVCGHPILMYADDMKDCYYDITVGGCVLFRALTIKMVKSVIKNMQYDCKCKGYNIRIVQDAACKSNIYLFPYAR